MFLVIFRALCRVWVLICKCVSIFRDFQNVINNIASYFQCKYGNGSLFFFFFFGFNMKEHQVTVMYMRHSYLQVGMAGNVCDELLSEDYFSFPVLLL